MTIHPSLDSTRQLRRPTGVARRWFTAAAAILVGTGSFSVALRAQSSSPRQRTTDRSATAAEGQKTAVPAGGEGRDEAGAANALAPRGAVAYLGRSARQFFERCDRAGP